MFSEHPQPSHCFHMYLSRLDPGELATSSPGSLAALTDISACVFPAPDSLTRHSGLWGRWRDWNASLRFPNTAPWGIKSLFQHFLPVRCQIRPSLSTQSVSSSYHAVTCLPGFSGDGNAPSACLLHVLECSWGAENRPFIRSLGSVKTPLGCCFQTAPCIHSPHTSVPVLSTLLTQSWGWTLTEDLDSCQSPPMATTQ